MQRISANTDVTTSILVSRFTCVLLHYKIWRFVPLRFRRNLIRCLYLRAKRICTSDATSDELEFLRQTLLLNGYPEGFSSNCMKETSPRTVYQKANKKILHLHLRFKGETLNEIITMKLNKVIRRTFPAAQLKISCATHPIFPSRSKTNCLVRPPQCVFINLTASVEQVTWFVQLGGCLRALSSTTRPG